MSTSSQWRGRGGAGRFLVAIALGLALGGCYAQQMADQERYDPLQESDFFANGMASRPVVEGTVARGRPREDSLRFEGKEAGQPATRFPLAVDMALLERGRERYEIFCTPCHDRVGNGAGIVVQRGFRRPPSLHIARLREAPPGYLFDVMTNGFGAMASYAPQVPADDRWAIVAYIRALQLSQYAPDSLLEDADFERLGGRR